MSADELAEAERVARVHAGVTSSIGKTFAALMAEYDRRGAEVERLRRATDHHCANTERELEQLRARMADGACAAFKCPDGLHPTWMLDPAVDCPWCAIERVRALCENPSAWGFVDGPSAEDVERALRGEDQS